MKYSSLPPPKKKRNLLYCYHTFWNSGHFVIKRLLFVKFLTEPSSVYKISLKISKNGLHIVHSWQSLMLYKGRQCDIRVPTRWRLSLLLPWLPHWCTSAPLRGALPLARYRVHNIKGMSNRTRVSTRWWRREKGWWPLLEITFESKFVPLTCSLVKWKKQNCFHSRGSLLKPCIFLSVAPVFTISFMISKTTEYEANTIIR